MEEPEDTISKTFRLSPKHLGFLESIHSNLNEAERICLDTLIRQQNRKRFKNWNNSILLISLGLIFFIFSVTAVDILLSIFTLLFGVFLTVYGLIMGVFNIEI